MAQLDIAYNTLDNENDDTDFGTFAPINDSKPQKKSTTYDMNDLLQARESDMKKQDVDSLLPKGIPSGIPVKQLQLQQQPLQQQQPQQPKKQASTGYYYDPDTFNKQFDQQQTYYKQQQYTQQQQIVAPPPQEPGYFERLFSKKKEFFKLIQWVLIVVLAISVHFFIDHYLKHYVNTTDLTPEREFLIRALYPLAILFILWNLRVFSVKP